MSKYKLIYKGKDFSPIPDSTNEKEDLSNFVEIRNENDDKVEIESFPLKNNLTEILLKFLNSFDEKTLTNIFKNIDEKEDEDEKSEKKKIYTTSANGYYFNGQIGFLRKENFKYLEVNESSTEITQYDLDITLICTSRFDDKKGYFICSMLLHSDLSFVDTLVPIDNNDDIFEYMLLFRYLSLLRESFVKGYYKKYVTFKNNDDRLKGSIDFARHIRLNSGYDNGKIAYSYRENTVKNPLNMLIIEAYKKLKKNYYDLMETCFTRDDEDIINSLLAEVGYVNYSTSELIKLNSKPIYHPYYFTYESLREICLKILRDEGMNIFAQEEIEQSNGFLVYIPNLWENFLKYQFNKFNELHFEAQDSHNVLYEKGDKEKYALNIRPDFVFHKDDKNFMILDAKFIPKWETAVDKRDFSKVSHDVNKCIRDMVCLELHNTGVIFPCKGDMNIFKTYEINSSDRFYAFGIKINSSSEFESFYQWNLLFEDDIKEQITNHLIPIIQE